MLLSGTLPFTVSSSNKMTLLEVIRTSELSFPNPLWANVKDKSVKALLKRVLQIDPATRMTAKELENHLELNILESLNL